MRWLRALSILAGVAVLSTVAHAQMPKLDKKEFNVVGTWNFLTPWQQLEKPFWTETLPKASDGAIKGNIKSVTELNLKGTEILRLLKTGVFDFANVLPIYVDDGGATIEALDIAGVARDFAMARDIANIWMPEIQKVMKERHNAIVLATNTWPEQIFYCRGDITSIADLKGKKVRVQGVSQSDLVGALGAAGVTIAFGEVVPALEKGVVDCGITGTMPAYKAKWPEVTNTAYRLPVGFTAGMWVANLSMWNKLSEDTRKFIQAELKKLEDQSWSSTIAETEEGVFCATGTGKCTVGPPGKLKLVQPSEADKKARDTALNTTVLKSWAQRCGVECAKKWTEVIGKKYSLEAKAN